MCQIQMFYLRVILKKKPKEKEAVKAEKPKEAKSGAASEHGRTAGGGSEASEIDSWKRAWSVVVRRDVLRQQRAIVTQQRDATTALKRTAIATQKEVRLL